MEIFFSKQIQNLHKILYLTCKFCRVRIFLTSITISETREPSAHRSAVSLGSNYDPLPYPSLKQGSQSSHQSPLSPAAAYNMIDFLWNNKSFLVETTNQNKIPRVCIYYEKKPDVATCVPQ